mmetsp:Transcript_9983/g.31863  ORF Transcript_9983/g.31863 Transcript_9983/m.31863 type:complete len:280 (-) Transcript_9983:896-1735(-)
MGQLDPSCALPSADGGSAAAAARRAVQAVRAPSPIPDAGDGRAASCLPSLAQSVPRPGRRGPARPLALRPRPSSCGSAHLWRGAGGGGRASRRRAERRDHRGDAARAARLCEPPRVRRRPLHRRLVRLWRRAAGAPPPPRRALARPARPPLPTPRAGGRRVGRRVRGGGGPARAAAAERADVALPRRGRLDRRRPALLVAAHRASCRRARNLAAGPRVARLPQPARGRLPPRRAGGRRRRPQAALRADRRHGEAPLAAARAAGWPPLQGVRDEQLRRAL